MVLRTFNFGVLVARIGIPHTTVEFFGFLLHFLKALNYKHSGGKCSDSHRAEIFRFSTGVLFFELKSYYAFKLFRG